MIDKLRLLLAIALIAAGIGGFYMMGEEPSVVRALSVMAGIVAAIAVMWSTATGQTALAFAKEAVAEARRVVWPSRKETIQITGVVILLVVVMAIFMWVVDLSLLSLVRVVMGRGE